jgi:hypothetical protein
VSRHPASAIIMFCIQVAVLGFVFYTGWLINGFEVSLTALVMTVQRIIQNKQLLCNSAPCMPGCLNTNNDCYEDNNNVLFTSICMSREIL